MKLSIIWFVGGDADLRQEFSQILTGLGYQVHFCADYQVFQRKILSGECPDALILYSPVNTQLVLKSLDFIRQRKIWHFLPVLVLLPEVSPESMDRIWEGGADGCLTLPISGEEVDAALSKAFQRRKIFS